MSSKEGEVLKAMRVLLASLTWKERMLPKLAANEAAAKDAKLALT